MKNIKRLSWIFGIILFYSCGSEEALFQVETFTDFTIPLGLNTVEAHYFINQNVPVTLQTQLDNLNIDREDIIQVVANSAILYPKFNESTSLDFIHSVNVFILEDINDLDSDTEVFFMDFVEPDNDREIRLFSSISDVTELLLNNSAIIAVRLEFRQFPPTSLEMRLDMSFGVYVEE